MRFLSIIIAAVIVAPALGQGTFRPSSLDSKQDQRLADHDDRFDRLEQNDERIFEALDKLATSMETLGSSAVAASDPVPNAEPAPQTAKVATQKPASVRPSPASRLPRSYIVKESVDGCLPCVAWDRTARKQIEAIGWTVIDEEMADPNGMAPRFRVYVSGKEYKHQGQLRWVDLWSIMEEAKGLQNPYRPTVQRPEKQSYGTSELSASIHAYRPGGWRGAVYRGVNEQRMSVYTHLTRDHGFSQQQVSGLSHDEALILHDNQHGPRNQRISPVRRDNLVSLPAESQQNVGCAFGGCAVQSTVNYQVNSSGWYPGKLLGR